MHLFDLASVNLRQVFYVDLSCDSALL